MARPREFDKQAAIETTMQVFWEKGYKATSIGDLITATGLKPGSIYSAFCNKRTLFLLALETYCEKLQQAIYPILDADKPAKEVIYEFFNCFLNDLNSTPQGCFLVNTLFETPQSDGEVLEKVHAQFSAIEQKFMHLLERARSEGHLAPNLDPEIQSKLLINLIYGLRGYSKTQPNQPSLCELKNEFLRTLFP
ncbi:MAG: TetR/AcrR family transcriptional regulator [Thiomicrospira sp.]|uniref:TetR/AcrR family transcriptional regulator n=1 Tax=Thiomicrospira sp. TaxID=935 RepID=UPI0019FDCF7F|nr:TetR/AcrR family transcriptional regulator [Thiomicrospira sp.]MBE0494204.1 TetR/AcrR family transcriptional regulator [Thiomicrospira sp.]